MSYEKVKAVRIIDNKVFINSSCNNDTAGYHLWECPSLTKILLEQGEEALNIEVLKTYEEGSFQATAKNKFSKALDVLRYVFKEEHSKYYWRNNNFKYGSEESKAFDEGRKSQEFKDLLLKCLNYKYPKDKFVITKQYGGFGGKYMVYAKVNPTCIGWRSNPDKATKFAFEEEAKNQILEKYKNEWKVIKIG